MRFPSALPIFRFVLIVCVAVIAPVRPAAQTASFAYAESTAATGFGQLVNLATDRAGNVYVADFDSLSVIRIDALTGAQTNIGSGFASIAAVAVDGAGNVFVADETDRLMVIPASGESQFSLAAGFKFPNALALDGLGNAYIAWNGGVTKVSVAAGTVSSPPASTLSTPATGAKTVYGVAADAAGDLFVGDIGNNQVIELTAGGKLSTLASGWTPGSLAVDPAGNLFAVDTTNLRIVEFPAGGGAFKPVITGLANAGVIAVDGSDRIYFTASDSTIEEFQTGVVDFGAVPVCPAAQQNTAQCGHTLTLNFNVSSAADFYPYSVTATSPTVTDFQFQSSTTCGVVQTGTTCTMVITFIPQGVGQRVSAALLGDQQGKIYSEISLFGTGVGPKIGFTGGVQTVLGTGLKLPSGVVVDGGGDVFITDTFNNRVVEIPAGGGAQQLVGYQFGLPTGIALDGTGNLYVAELSAGDVIEVPGPGFGAAGPIASGFKAPIGVLVDPLGNFYVAASGDNVIARLPAGSKAFGTIGTGLLDPAAVAADGAGNVYIADSGNNRVVELRADGSPQLEIGNGLSQPQGLAIDAAGDVFISDSGNNRIVEVPADGSAQFTFATGFKQPIGIAFDSHGDLYVADSMNNRVVKISTSAPPSLHFATTEVGSRSAPQTLTVQNMGNQPLAIAGVTYPYDFPIAFSVNGMDDLCSGATTLVAGATCDLAFEFAPTQVLSNPEQFLVTDNNGNVDGSQQSIELIGIAKLPQSIVFLLPSSTPFNPSPTNLAGYAASTSGLPVSFKVVSGPAKLSGTTITLTGAGTVVIQATQPGNSSYVAATPVSVSIKITKATPVVTWFTPASIAYGTKLSTGQLNAVASAAGKLAYTPALGTALAAGTHTLSVTFTPTNTSGFASVTTTVKVVVTKAVLTVEANDLTMTKGGTVPKLTMTYTGFVNGDTAAKALTGAPALTTTAKSTSAAGIYPITVKQGTLAAANYSFTFLNGNLLVTSGSTGKRPAIAPAGGPVKPTETQGEPEARK